MDFELPEEHPARTAVRDWLAENPTPSPREMADAGYVVPHWPKPWGLDAGPIEQLLISDELKRAGISRPINPIGIGHCGPILVMHGTEEQKKRYIPPMLSAEEIWCQLFSEPGAGSDLAGLATKAERDGDEWIVNGQKVWTTFAHRCDWGLCIARTDPDVERHRGLTAFIVDMRSPGVVSRPLRQMTGSAMFNEVFLEDVRVSDDRRVADVGDGWRVAITTFMFERSSLLSMAAGVSEPMEALVKRTADNVQRDRWMRTWIGGRVLFFNNLRMLTALSQGRVPGPEGSIAKLVGTTLLSDLYDHAMDLLGADAMLAGGDAPAGGEWQDAFLGTPGLRIGGGTDQIQRNIIAERILGLPKDARGT